MPPSSTNRTTFFRAFRRRLAAGVAVVAAGGLVPIDIARADVAGEMNSFFNEAGGAANVTGPSAYQGQTAGYYTGGNLWTRFPQKSITPFNLQLPSARAGCGGIDLFTGSFSFINAGEIVAMLKATANNALGFAFKLAIDTVSPQIGKVMSEFQQAAQQLNQMNISSCEAAQGLVGSVWPKMQGARSTICTSIANSQGMFSDWARSRQKCNADGELDTILANNSDAAMAENIPGAKRNYTWQAIKRSNKFGGADTEFSEYLMTLVGTVIVDTTPSTPGGGAGGVIRYIGPAEDAVVTALLDGTTSANPVKILKCDTAEDCLNPTEQNLPHAEGLRKRVKDMIDSIDDKIRTDAALTPAEIQLLNMTPLPLYKILAVQNFAHQTPDPGSKDVLAEMVAVTLLAAMIDNMVDRVTQAQVHFQPADQATATAWRQQLREAREKYSQREYKVKDTIKVTESIINKTIMLESTLQNSMSPGMAASLNFSRGLNAQGLR